MTVEISSALLDRIRAEAAADPEREICGLLFGRDDRRIEDAGAAANVAADPARSFEIEPTALLAAHRAHRTGGLRLLGCYHSHPNGAAMPSPRDADSVAPTAGFLWLIVASGAARLFREALDGSIHGAFDPVELAVVIA